MGAFFDDICTMDPSPGGSGPAFVAHVLQTAGAPGSPDKAMPLGQHRTWLGVAVNLSEVLSTGHFYIQPKTSAITQVQASCRRALAEGILTSAPASKLRGQANWTASLAAGKCGRASFHALKQHQCGSQRALTEADRNSLEFLAKLVAALPPKAIQVVCPPALPSILYTDASFEPSLVSLPRGGWILSRPDAPVQGHSIEIAAAVVASWEDRATHITPAEAWTVFAALAEHAKELSGQDVIAFIDNEAAAASIIRGDSAHHDMADIAQGIQWLAVRHRIRLWVEWMDSGSNPADGLSRDGHADPWTARQGWELAPGRLPRALTAVTLRDMIRETLGMA